VRIKGKMLAEDGIGKRERTATPEDPGPVVTVSHWQSVLQRGQATSKEDLHTRTELSDTVDWGRGP
jgi:hypothetical protein